MIISSPLAVECEMIRSVMEHVMLYVPALNVVGVVTLKNDWFLNGTEFAAGTSLKEQLMLVTFSISDILMSTSIPPKYPTAGVNVPSWIPHWVLYLGSDGRRHSPQRSFTCPPLGTPAQSKQVELVPLHTPHASLPKSADLLVFPSTHFPQSPITAVPRQSPLQSFGVSNPQT
jgi:hypothetical protein